MRRRALARFVATAFVALLCAAPVTKSPASFEIFPNPASSQLFPTDSQPLVYFTVFNNGGTNLSVTVNPPGADGQCAQVTFTALDNARGQPGPTVVLAPSELQEFVATPPAMLSSSLSCPSTVDAIDQVDGSLVTQTVTLDFDIGTPTTTLDAQPAQLTFGTRFAADAVAQVVHVTNLGTGSATETISVMTGTENVTLTGGSGAVCTSASCTATLGFQGASTDVLVTCAPADTNPVTIEVTDGATTQDIVVGCAQESIAGSTISLAPVMMMAADGTMASASTTVAAASGTLLTDAYLLTTDTSIQFQTGSGSPCNLDNATYCQFVAGQDVSVPLNLVCTAHSTETQTATLIVHGSSDLDTAIATVSCVASGGGAMFGAQPMSLAFGTQPVGTPSPMTVTFGDSSMTSSSLTDVVVSIDDPTDYGLSCGSAGASSCSLGTIGPGQTQQVTVTFTPSAPTSLPTTLRFTASDATELDVAITGAGAGVAIVLDQPDPNGVPFGIHFGSIGRGSAQTATIEITANGTLSTTTVVEPMFTGDPLFSLSGTDIDLGGGGQSGSVTLSCGSDTAGSASGQVTLATSNAFAGSNIVIPVDCTVAPTDVSASPNMVRFGDQFGELRRDDGVAPQMQTITLSNAGVGTSTIGTVTMQPSSGHVTFTQPATSVGAGSATSFQITVTPDATNSSKQTFDEDFTTNPLVLTIPVDGTMLTVTVTGKVVKAQTSLAPMPPTALDLGTVCIGGTGMATALLSNAGTAHVGAMTPMIGSGFTIALAGSAELAPGSGAAAQETATVTSVAATAGGEVDGTLVWTTDVPDDYKLPVKVVYVATGLGVSPDTLPFGEQPDGTISTAKTVTVQNCGTGSATATIGEVDNHVGPASAWQVSQRGAYRLAPGQVMTVAVAFSPHHGGHFYAELPIAAGGVTTDIELTGDAPGPGDQAQTDFYACGCHGPGVPLHGWPIAAVIVVVVRRRPKRRR